MRRTVIGLQMRDDIIRMIQNVLGMAFVHPSAVDAASCLAVGPITASDRGFLF
jgi:hypothetical protein